MKQTNLRKSDIILHTLNPYDPEMQRYLSLSKRIEQLMNNAEDETTHVFLLSSWQNSLFCKKNFIRRH